MSKGLVTLIVAAALCVLACAQTNNTNAGSAIPNVLGNAGAVLGAVQMQQQLSTQYAKAILNIQAASSWVQVAQSWSLQLLKDKQSGDSSYFQLEEEDNDNENDDDDEDAATFKQLRATYSKTQNLEEMFPYMNLMPVVSNAGKYDNKAVELQGEQALLTLSKIWHIQAADKLADTQRAHYQSKVQLMLLSAAGGQASQLLSLTYYRNILASISSMATIQKQDAFNTWVILDLLETHVSELQGNSLFLASLTTAQHNAMAALYMEAALDVQIMYLDMFVSQLIGVPMANANANAASFLEVEEKPFFPFMGYSNPAYLGQYLRYLKIYSKILFMQAAQSLFTAAQLDLSNVKAASEGKAQKFEKYSRLVFSYTAVPALTQWAQINSMLAYFDIYSMYSAMYAQPQMHPAASAAAMSDLLQTDATTSAPQEPVESLVAPKIENETVAPAAANVDPVADSEHKSLIA